MLYDTVFLPKPCVCCDFHLKLLWNCYLSEIIVKLILWWNCCAKVALMKQLWKCYPVKIIVKMVPGQNYYKKVSLVNAAQQPEQCCCCQWCLLSWSAPVCLSGILFFFTSAYQLCTKYLCYSLHIIKLKVWSALSVVSWSVQLHLIVIVVIYSSMWSGFRHCVLLHQTDFSNFLCFSRSCVKVLLNKASHYVLDPKHYSHSQHKLLCLLDTQYWESVWLKKSGLLCLVNPEYWSQSDPTSLYHYIQNIVVWTKVKQKILLFWYTNQNTEGTYFFMSLSHKTIVNSVRGKICDHTVWILVIAM